MKKVLLKDLVIPAGTVFSDAPVKTERADDAFVECVIGLTKNTVGYVTYEVSDEVKDWFADLRQ